MTQIISNRLLLLLTMFFAQNLFAQDPDFHIYLAFGQSNMEGNGAIETQDKTVDARFRVMASMSCGNLSRTQGQWYTAVPPLFRCNTGLSLLDNFGKTMVSQLPGHIRVGVVGVAVGGTKIELFDKVNYQAYLSTAESWVVSGSNDYGGNPYARLVEVAKQAQKVGVIKGILLHQGESNTGDKQWPTKVKNVYEDLLKDLGLQANSVPLLAGQLVSSAQGGSCGSMNAIIDTLPRTIPTAHIISSTGLAQKGDGLHFTSASYRTLGSRYATKMLELLGPASEPVPQSAYDGKIHAIPGKIEFEHFDIGGNDSAYYDDSPGSETEVAFRTDEDVDIEVSTDVGGGHNVGYATSGEWLEYTVNVSSTAIYQIEIRVACSGTGRTLSLQSNGKSLLTDVAVPNTGDWQTWQTITVPNVALTAGKQVLRVVIGAEDYVNLNFFQFSLAQPVTLFRQYNAFPQNLETSKAFDLIGRQIVPYR